MTLEDEFAVNEPPLRHRVVVDNRNNGGGDLEDAVLALVREDPFASIREMARELRIQPYFEETGWWRVFRILKRNRLLTRRARFRFVRPRRRDLFV